MIEIIRGEEWVLNLYPKETEDIKYKISDYAIIEKYNNGFLLLHTLTWSIFFITQEEYNNILNNDYFKQYKIILDEKINEDLISKEVYLKRAHHNILPTYEKLDGYIIFTTNSCNAQCFYCYEKNKLKPIGMTLKTAEDVVQFIKKTHKSHINIQWFGGEPLLNIKVIDYITQRLQEEKIYYTSSIISNALLFDDYLITKSINKWHLNFAQITIDGTENTYNKVKNYKNSNINPYKKVMENIHYMLNSNNIIVNIRFNATEANINEIEDLLKYFTEKYKEQIKNKFLRLTITPIYEILNDDNKISSPIFEDIKKLKIKYNLNTPSFFKEKSRQLQHCMSDKGHYVVINPLGYLSICEHWYDSNIIGDIQNGITNKNIIEEWNKKDGDNISFCLKTKCKYLPICEHYNKCESSTICKNTLRQDYKKNIFIKMLKNTYDIYIKNNPTN